MFNPQAQNQPAISLFNGQLTTTSLDIAERFGKRHADVIRAINKLECSPIFHQRNFALMSVEIKVGNGGVRNSPAYRITRDGFSFLCMGFTGKEAAKWKEAYINAFNAMEDALKQNTPTLTACLGRELGLHERALVTRSFETGEYVYQIIAHDKCVMNPTEFMRAITTPMDMPVPSEELFEFVQRATHLLSQRHKAIDYYRDILQAPTKGQPATGRSLAHW